jgi:peptidoglycan hydrolase CwlO-like protein
MRDIRGDLQDRAEALERELTAAQARFDELMLRLKQEHDDRLDDLKNELDAVKLLIGLEQRRLAGVANGHPAVKPQPQPQQSEAPRPQAQQSEAPRPQAQATPPRAPQQEAPMRKAG